MYLGAEDEGLQAVVPDSQVRAGENEDTLISAEGCSRATGKGTAGCGEAAAEESDSRTWNQVHK